MMSKPQTNRFDLSHDVKLSFQMGELVPTCCLEALPGDSFNISPQNFLRFAPLISPVMHRVRVKTEYFFVPTRLLWAQWDKWITGDLEVQAPYTNLVNGSSFDEGSIWDYLGFPTDTNNTGETIPVSPMAVAAYRLIWDEFYRDQNLQSKVFVPLVPGDNSADYAFDDNSVPYPRAWEHDYFTSCLPFAQKGDSVQVPLTTADNQVVEWQSPGPSDAENTGLMRDATTGSVYTNAGTVNMAGGPTPLVSGMHVGTDPVSYDPNGTLVVDVQSDATDINTLRRAFRIQEWLEKNARGGTRYVESILAHFGIKSSDARLQRPEFVGSSRQNMVISEVLATAQSTDDGVAVGTMAGHGISVGGGNSFSYRAEEHGFIIGLISVVPDTAYQQGIHRQFTRFDRLDYAWPTFANIGEQEVLRKELYIDGSGSPDTVFGYIPRYSEYKFANSRVSGEMKGSLAFWHLGRIFSSTPLLNSEFIECKPDSRIFAVTDPAEDHVISHVYNQISVVRKLPRFGIPTI